jgi:hypothetical protein
MSVTGPIANKPPLSVWIAATLAAVVLFLALGNLHRTAWLAASVDRTAGFNLQRLQSVPSDALHVVAMGSSKSMYAIDFDDAFAARLAAPGRRVVFHRITASEPGIGDMQPVLEAIAQRPPDVLLVETELLLFDRGEPATFPALLKHARQNLSLLRTQLAVLPAHREVDNNRGLEEWSLEAICKQSQAPDAQLAYADYAARWRITTDAERAADLDYLRRMRAAGTQVILLTVPRSPSADAVVPPRLKQESALLRERLMKQEGFIEWEPDTMGESLYCDQIHVNQRGRAFYSAWLAKQLAALLGVRSGV